MNRNIICRQSKATIVRLTKLIERSLFVGEYEQVKKAPFKQRLSEHWNSIKSTVPYTLAIIFVQIINLMLTLLFNVYSEGVIINIGILSILVASLVMDIAQKNKRSWFARKLKGIIRNISYCLVPLILLFTTITVMTIAFKPPTYFPNEWKFTDNNWARFATVDKFRVSQIELKYPVTFKLTIDQVDALVDNWVAKNKFKVTKGDDKFSNGYSYYFSNYKAYSLFGMMNDVFIRVVECSDVWGGVKIEAHSNIRLGLKDYGSNLDIIKDLYSFVDKETSKDVNRSYFGFFWA